MKKTARFRANIELTRHYFHISIASDNLAKKDNMVNMFFFLTLGWKNYDAIRLINRKYVYVAFDILHFNLPEGGNVRWTLKIPLW